MKDSFIIPGFPTEVSDYIDVPDVAELLMYPFFQIALADTVYKYGTEFQRKLLDMTPLKNNKKHVTCFFMVHIMDPAKRAITSYSNKGKGWHIDGLEAESHDYKEANETIHLLLSNCKSVSEFNINPITFEDQNLTRKDFNRYINENADKLGIVGKSIEQNKIYTFNNHIHRAVSPTRIEFRLTWRVRETDREDIPSIKDQILKQNRVLNIYTRETICNIEKQNNNVILHYPHNLT